eukprot:scaffold14074_cov111-Isochrysis_galbana.AAC.5
MGGTSHRVPPPTAASGAAEKSSLSAPTALPLTPSAAVESTVVELSPPVAVMLERRLARSHTPDPNPDRLTERGNL